MNTITVHNQAEWDALTEGFDEFTAIHVYSDPKVPLVIKRTPENATVEASENATVEASENATVRAWENATVRAWENAILRLLSDTIKSEAFHSVTIICQDCKPTIKRHGTGVAVVRTKTFRHTVKSFCEIYGDGTKPLTLYKSVKEDGCDHHTGRIKYKGAVECPDWDPNPNRQCGGGLHLSPTPYDALRYHDGKVLVCEVARKDIVVFPTDVTKVRCRKVKVIGEWKKEVLREKGGRE